MSSGCRARPDRTSIPSVASELIKQRPGERRLSESYPWVVAFAFGLLHGFGFAGALKETGLPQTDVPIALLTFNLGVEAGQLLFVAFVWIAFAACRRVATVPATPARLVAAYDRHCLNGLVCRAGWQLRDLSLEGTKLACQRPLLARTGPTGPV
jgi:hypothetical protein